MKIKRYSARDMRSALRAVQQEQGPDAVILSTHETREGIELVAAVDYDESLIRHASGRKPGVSQDADDAATTASGFDVSGVAASAAGGDAMALMEQRLEAMQELLQNRLDAVAGTCRSNCPGHQAAYALLTRMGIAASRVDELLKTLPSGLNVDAARQAGLQALASALPIGRQELLHDGGAVALMGPTGVGKTTTAAKLAARHILRFGQGSVQFVGTDEFRIGAQEQLAAFSRILGAPLHRIQAADELGDILDARQSQELIVIDTAGVGGRDLKLHQQFACLLPQQRIHRALCLSASTAPMDLLMQARRFDAARPNCLILTKLDETRQLGQALSFIAGQALPLAYATDGQQVPEDLHVARGHDLVARALDQCRRAGQPENLRACA